MRLRINIKGSSEFISLDIASNVRICDLVKLVYAKRHPVFDEVPLDVFQKTVALKITNLYSDSFETDLDPVQFLSDYCITESSTIVLEHCTQDKFSSTMNQLCLQKFDPNPSFFSYGVGTTFFENNLQKNQVKSGDKENSEGQYSGYFSNQ